MLDKVKTLKGYTFKGRDGEIGSVSDLYFDDHFWAIRYLVADTGTWLKDRSVLISPYAVEAVDREARQIVTTLTRKQIEDSPSWDSDKPVSRQYEESYHGYYGWPSYWGGPYMWGTYPSIARDPEYWKGKGTEEKTWDPHLRSIKAVTGYHVMAPDGDVGHVSDFVIDNESWAIRYLVVDTKNWWPGRKVLVSVDWIERVSWEESTVFVAATRESIRQAPEYADEALLSRDYESRLHGHYDRSGYWLAERSVAKHGG